jgi:hypothetical protein
MEYGLETVEYRCLRCDFVVDVNINLYTQGKAINFYSKTTYIINQTASERESNLFSKTTYNLDQRYVIVNICCFRLKMSCRFSRNTSECVLLS